MQFQDSENTQLAWLVRAAHAAVIIASAVSAGLLYQKFVMSGWEPELAIGGAFFAFVGMALASEGCSVFSTNFVGLFLQTEKSVKEIMPQLIFAAIGAIVTGAAIFGLAFFSVKNIVSLQAASREAQTININDLPKVKPLYDAVKSLELAFEGANNEYQSAQERFKSYQGTNQYQNLGKANQAAVKAQNRKDRLEAELSQTREQYMTAYTAEEAKGTNLLDRADAGFNSKLYVAGMFEVGAVLMAMIGVMLSAYSKSFTLIHLASFKWPKIKDKDEPAKAAEVNTAAQVEAPKSEVKIQDVIGKPPKDMDLDELLAAVCQGRLDTKEICNHFPEVRPHQARRLVKRTLQDIDVRVSDARLILERARKAIERTASVAYKKHGVNTEMDTCEHLQDTE